MRTPPGLSAARFQSALREFAAALGDEWVYTKDEDVALYDDSYTPFVGEPELQRHASAAVAPADVEQVQKVVVIANKYGVPLHPVSTGRNLGYGGSAPVYSGSVVVDLKRMNRVLEVNEREAYMIVEPGVSFITLQRYFDEHKLPFLVSTPDPGWGSPIGNALEHGISPQAGDNFGMLKGVEVVLPNGELLRTGMGGVPTARMWANYPYGYGPVLHGIFSQSNFGIVTKAVFWLVRRPEAEQGFTVTTFAHDRWQSMIDAVQLMREHGVLYSTGFGSSIRESMAANDGRQPYGVQAVRDLHATPDGGTPAQWEKLARDTKIPVARVSGAARGPASMVRAAMEHARDVFSRIPDVTFKLGDPVDFDNYSGRPRIEFGILGVQPPSHGHFYFSPVYKATVEDALALNDTIRRTMLSMSDRDMLDNYGWSAGWTLSYPKACMVLMSFLVHDDVALNRRRRELFKRLVQACGERGWAEYRAPAAFQDEVMNQYTFNNHVLRRFNEMIKDGIDPNGILAPGKSGIWPKRLRKERGHA